MKSLKDYIIAEAAGGKKKTWKGTMGDWFNWYCDDDNASDEPSRYTDILIDNCFKDDDMTEFTEEELEDLVFDDDDVVVKQVSSPNGGWDGVIYVDKKPVLYYYDAPNYVGEK